MPTVIAVGRRSLQRRGRSTPQRTRIVPVHRLLQDRGLRITTGTVVARRHHRRRGRLPQPLRIGGQRALLLTGGQRAPIERVRVVERVRIVASRRPTGAMLAPVALVVARQDPQ